VASSSRNAGGGGGSVGRVRINSTSAPTLSGIISPALSSTAATKGALWQVPLP
jgi:hypothetical protein